MFVWHLKHFHFLQDCSWMWCGYWTYVGLVAVQALSCAHQRRMCCCDHIIQHLAGVFVALAPSSRRCPVVVIALCSICEGSSSGEATSVSSRSQHGNHSFPWRDFVGVCRESAAAATVGGGGAARPHDVRAHPKGGLGRDQADRRLVGGATQDPRRACADCEGLEERPTAQGSAEAQGETPVGVGSCERACVATGRGGVAGECSQQATSELSARYQG